VTIRQFGSTCRSRRKNLLGLHAFMIRSCALVGSARRCSIRGDPRNTGCIFPSACPVASRPTKRRTLICNRACRILGHPIGGIVVGKAGRSRPIWHDAVLGPCSRRAPSAEPIKVGRTGFKAVGILMVAVGPAACNSIRPVGGVDQVRRGPV